MSTIKVDVASDLTLAEVDTLEERQNQRVEGWDKRNTSLSIDNYIGLALAYAGRATLVASRNAESDRRSMLVKAAALLIQCVDQIDEGKVFIDMLISKSEPVVVTRDMADEIVRNMLEVANRGEGNVTAGDTWHVHGFVYNVFASPQDDKFIATFKDTCTA